MNLTAPITYAATSFGAFGASNSANNRDASFVGAYIRPHRTSGNTATVKAAPTKANPGTSITVKGYYVPAGGQCTTKPAPQSKLTNGCNLDALKAGLSSVSDSYTPSSCQPQNGNSCHGQDGMNFSPQAQMMLMMGMLMGMMMGNSGGASFLQQMMSGAMTSGNCGGSFQQSNVGGPQGDCRPCPKQASFGDFARRQEMMETQGSYCSGSASVASFLGLG